MDKNMKSFLLQVRNSIEQCCFSESLWCGNCPFMNHDTDQCLILAIDKMIQEDE